VIALLPRNGSARCADDKPQTVGKTRREQLGFVAAVPLGRMGTPDEVANAAVFLASGDSSYVAGIELFVDGGVAQV
jgi:NAD(P)-dependent dehydrogenase (short-subunit alcohol dehydrogenase family)